MRPSRLVRNLVVFPLLSAAIIVAQAHPPITQESTRSLCSNIVALDGDVKVDCSRLSPEQEKRILDLANRMLERLKKIESEVNTTGLLEPDTRPDDPRIKSLFMTPRLSGGGIVVQFGGNLVIVKGSKCTILRIEKEDLLWVERKNDGLLISAKVFDPEHKIMADIQQNNVTVNPNKTFKRSILKHTLDVVSESDQDVLNVDFVNSHDLIVQGTFPWPGRGTVTADSNALKMSTANVHDFVVSGSITDCFEFRPAFMFTFENGMIMAYQ